jgi:hypothetical protein
MVDDLRSDDGFGGFESHTHRPLRRVEKERPLADREVPIGAQEPDARVLSPAIHQWLDGELPEATLRKGDTAREVEFWKNINGEVERRRRMQTPAYMEARIMQALPQSAPALITPWHQREFVITPKRAVAVASGLIAFTAALTAAIMAAVS